MDELTGREFGGYRRLRNTEPALLKEMSIDSDDHKSGGCYVCIDCAFDLPVLRLTLYWRGPWSIWDERWTWLEFQPYVLLRRQQIDECLKLYIADINLYPLVYQYLDLYLT